MPTPAVDLGAIDYDDGVHAKHRLTALPRLLRRPHRRGERVLDVGCGKGELAHDIAERTRRERHRHRRQPVDAGVRARSLRASERDVRAGRRGRLRARASRSTSLSSRTSSSTSSHASSSCAHCASAPARAGCSSASRRSIATGRCRCGKRSGSRTSPTRSTRSSTTRSSFATSSPRRAGRWASRCSSGARSGSKRQLELGEELCVAIEPRLEREPLDGSLPRGSGIGGAVGEHARTASASASGDGGSSRSQLSGMRHADPGLVADELDGAPARRIHDRQPAGHRLDHSARARVLDLRVQQEMRAAHQRRARRAASTGRRARRARACRARRAAAAPVETSRPVTSSVRPARGEHGANVRSASSSRYACVWSPPSSSTGPAGRRARARA